MYKKEKEKQPRVFPNLSLLMAALLGHGGRIKT
jgi:hypothetical protein